MMLKAAFLAGPQLFATVAAVVLLSSCVVGARAELTASELVTAMRLNDSLLPRSVLEGAVVQKILPAPSPTPRTFQVVVAGGEDISALPGVDRLLELMIKYGNAKEVPLADVPADLLPLVRLIRDGKVSLKQVDSEPVKRVTHRSYAYTLAQYDGDIALRLHGGSRHQEALTLAVISRGRLISSLEYFAGTWERVDRVSSFPVNLSHERALWYCFALGVGFGERIQSATLESSSRGQYVLNAKVSIWPGQTHGARLVVDSEGLVREADIECTYKRICSMSSETRTIREADTRIASRGKVVVTAPGGREKVNLSVKLSNTRSSLSEADFAGLCDLSVLDGLPVYYQNDGYASERVLMSTAE